MRHRIAGRQLSRNSSHRRNLRRNMAAALIQHEAIKTTEAKAKELRRFVEKLITLAKTRTLHARRRAKSLLQDYFQFQVRNGGRNPEEDIEDIDQTIIEKLFDVVGPRYADRPGGYTRIIRLADRRIGDGGVQVILQLVEESSSSGGKQSGSGRRGKKASKKYDAVEKATGEKSSGEGEELEVAGDDGEGEAPDDSRETEPVDNAAEEPGGAEAVDGDADVQPGDEDGSSGDDQEENKADEPAS